MLTIYRDLQSNDISVRGQQSTKLTIYVWFSVMCIDVEPHYVKYKLKVI
jgi:hypothetical protein